MAFAIFCGNSRAARGREILGRENPRRSAPLMPGVRATPAVSFVRRWGLVHTGCTARLPHRPCPFARRPGRDDPPLVFSGQKYTGEPASADGAQRPDFRTGGRADSGGAAVAKPPSEPQVPRRAPRFVDRRGVKPVKYRSCVRRISSRMRLSGLGPPCCGSHVAGQRIGVSLKPVRQRAPHGTRTERRARPPAPKVVRPSGTPSACCRCQRNRRR